jgi:hypothetical protein
MWIWTLLLSLPFGVWNASAISADDDLPFCSCESSPCADEAAPDEPPCITFDEATELAAQPNSGIYKVTTSSEPKLYGAVNASASNTDAICEYGSCFVKGAGQVELAAYGHQSLFFGWSGCSDSSEPHIKLGPLTANADCVAHFGPGLIVVNTRVVGRDDGAQVQIAGSCTGSGGCSFLNGGTVTLSAPPSDARFTFTGWSGCSTSTEPTLTLTNVRQALPECVAQYASAAPL